MKKDFYSVSSNPVTPINDHLIVLFSGISQTEPNHALGPKIYDHYLLHVIESGKGNFQTEHGVFELGAGDAFLIHPGELVSYASHGDEPWLYRWVAFTGLDARTLVEAAGMLPDSPVVYNSGSRRSGRYIRLIQESFRRKQDQAHIAAAGYLHLLWAELMNHTHRTVLPSMAETQIQRTVKQMISVMSSQYAHPVSIEQMCSSLGYNRAYLSRIFKKETGLPPVTYLLKLRMDQAKRLLRERPELSVEQVSASVGLPDSLYFSRQFKRFYSLSPTSYRRENGGT
ncbi:AraC family transcriptional regulator [Paenibacillus lemnae]|uniref:AraC family transcriptional regulator n=1 Tax=Paenibacillus lemnae TaxID=1330551 RepID=A0A848MA53_PAELE|nr:AraC family transcriptional regulator [Paenibacillus lemnae]